jgi:hypothetical protein
VSRLPVLEPTAKGVVIALGSVALASLGAYFFLMTMPAASPELLRSMALIGASLLIAYVIEAVWLVPRVEIDDQHEEWLGFLVGAALAALLGIVIALLLAEHRAVGHANFLDDFGLAWATVSLLILGGVLVLQPLLADRYGSAD